MNRFRSRKKSHGDGGDASRRPSVDSDVPSLPSFSSRTFRKKKKVEPEPKPEVDITNALPSSDDFRTSLLMPNLSARFSMLREQDDPTSKLGKANDDSVLFPKRASRLELFNNSNRAGLSDIAEVDSIRGGSVPRPPFLSNRTESYGSEGYGTDDASIMSRAKPGEGNTMFGGRQKIYKIPVGQAGSLKNYSSDDVETSSRKNMGGKALYESDTFPSAFQLAQERERRERQEREASGSDHSNTRTSKEQDRSGSPLAKYNQNRETTSSINSGPSQSRASTAATSIASQKSIYGAHEAINGTSPNMPAGAATSDRPLPKGKKMYGQGLDHFSHDQPSSSIQRINSLTRQRGGLARNITQSKSATNLNDKFQKVAPVYATNGFRAASPSPSPTPPRMQEFDLGLNGEAAANGHVDSGYGKTPPGSPPVSPDMGPVQPDATLVAALEPNDVGKATASGAFNKPAKQYNEQQYLQRQLQLQEERNTPSPVAGRPFSPPNAPHNDTIGGRSRNDSQGSSTFSRTGSVRHPWEHHMEDRVLRPVPERGRSPSVQNSTRNSLRNEPDEPNSSTGERTFFGGMSGSEIGSNPESESEADPNSPIPSSGRFQGFRQPGQPPPSQTRPVQLNTPFNFELNNSHLAEPAEETTSDSRSYKSETTITQHQQDFKLKEVNQNGHLDPDSPTLGPVGVQNGLSGMLHQHLRNVSGTSSVYPEDSPRRSRPEIRESIFGHESALSQQDMWKDEAPQQEHWRVSGRQSDDSVPPVPQPLSFAARHMLEQAAALKQQDSRKAKQFLGDDKAQRVLGGEAPRSSHESTPSWQEQLKAHHARVGSTETQRERESLANELEARKRIVRNNLQTFAEGESRDASPAPGSRNQESSPGPAFSFLRKGSGTPPTSKQDKPSKAMKMLGFDSNGVSESENPPHDLFMGREQLADRAMPPNQKGLKPRPKDVRQQSDESPTKSRRGFFGNRSNQASRRTSPHSSKSGSDGSDRRPHSRKGSVGKVNGVRSEGESFDMDGVFPGADKRNGNSPPRQVMDVGNGRRVMPPPPLPVSMSGRLRSNSRPNVPNGNAPVPFEQRTAPPGTPVMINPSSRPATANSHPYPTSPPSNIPNNPSQYSMTYPTMINPQNNHPQNNHQTSPRSHRNRSINKQDISEPTFISTTSTFDTVDLPPGASLSNGMDEVNQPNSAPPIPNRDSRRKRTPNLFHAFGGRSERRPESPSISSPIQANFSNGMDGTYDQGITSPVNGEAGSRPGTSSDRVQIRSGSSEDENMNVRPKNIAKPSAAPVTPTSPPKAFQDISGGSAVMKAEQHLPYRAQQDVPASAVMF